MCVAWTDDGTQEFVYGDVGEIGRCVDTPPSADATVAVDAETKCEGGYPGIYHLQGNAYEWEAGCQWSTYDEGLAPAFCSIRGGTAGDEVQGYEGCAFRAGVFGNDDSPNDWAEFVGFRCCADPLP